MKITRADFARVYIDIPLIERKYNNGKMEHDYVGIQELKEKTKELYECLLSIQKIGAIRFLNNTQIDCEIKTKEICSLCGYEWEIDKETNEPACCNEAIEEAEKAREGV